MLQAQQLHALCSSCRYYSVGLDGLLMENGTVAVSRVSQCLPAMRVYAWCKLLVELQKGTHPEAF
jgi:hypothetical protein